MQGYVVLNSSTFLKEGVHKFLKIILSVLEILHKRAISQVTWLLSTYPLFCTKGAPVHWTKEMYSTRYGRKEGKKAVMP